MRRVKKITIFSLHKYVYYILNINTGGESRVKIILCAPKYYVPPKLGISQKFLLVLLPTFFLLVVVDLLRLLFLYGNYHTPFSDTLHLVLYRLLCFKFNVMFLLAKVIARANSESELELKPRPIINKLICKYMNSHII